MKLPRKRTKWLIGGSILVLLYAGLTHPAANIDFGFAMPAWLSIISVIVGTLAMPVIAIWFSWLAVSALADYISGEELYNKAKTTSVGAGIAYLARAILLIGAMMLFGAQLNKAQADPYIPVQAQEHIATVKIETTKYWSDNQYPFILLP